MEDKKNDELQPLIPIYHKYPNMFKWKTGSMIVIFLIAVVAVADFCIQIHIWNNPDPTANTSFFNDIIRSDGVFENGKQARHLLNNMLTSDPQIFFKRSIQLTQSEGKDITKDWIIKQIFNQKSKDLLFIFNITGKNTNTSSKFGIFIAPDFPIPEDYVKPNISQYYTFQFGAIRQSMAFNLNTDASLVMNGGKDKSQVMRNDLCKTYQFNYHNSQFEFLRLFGFDLLTSQLYQKNITDGCYILPNNQTPQNKLVQVIGINLTDQNATINKLTVFHLYNEE